MKKARKSVSTTGRVPKAEREAARNHMGLGKLQQTTGYQLSCFAWDCLHFKTESPQELANQNDLISNTVLFPIDS